MSKSFLKNSNGFWSLSFLTQLPFSAIDMTFDEDTKLFGLMRRYSDPEEIEELKRQVISYVRT